MAHSLCRLGWLLLGSLVFSVAARAADPADYGAPGGGILLPEDVTKVEVQKAILESAVGRGWTIVLCEDGKVVIAFTQDTWTSKLTLTYTERDVQIFSVSTRKGKPKLPANWIKFLKEDITKKLNVVALSRMTKS